MGRAELLTVLNRALAQLNFSPRRELDPVLTDALVSLYGNKSADEIWARHLRPFVEGHALALENIFREQALSPTVEAANGPEFLLVLERAENDGLGLNHAWPGSADELERISDIWGVPVASD